MIALENATRLSGDSSGRLMARVITADSAALSATRVSGWGIDSADTDLIHLWFGNGYVGSRFTLRRTADTLSGHARRFHDFETLSLTHRARAIRTACVR